MEHRGNSCESVANSNEEIIPIEEKKWNDMFYLECGRPKESPCRRATCSEIRPILVRKADCIHDQ